ncbi:aromatic amino acid exporter YddG [Propylenella binzhouense]|uniref:EamA family transporter n=1 Tax=Propylenella binzhouense TaxID=2555902 RepID=A0A964T551_9HYPH|nr:EamA family transporter [Propylenella binzhouense]MYZ48643.1 EamA family transporter [Propylenella binzhouense]
MPSRRRAATFIGFLAILMWALLALFTAASGAVPPFQLSAMAFLVGGVLGLLWLAATRRWRDLRQPWPVWLLGVGGLFGYHALYFTALRHAPPVEASLIAYLWPLMIVVLSALLPGERLRWYHVAGALMGLAGTVLIVGRGGLSFDPRYGPGYLAAAGCALTWSAYSILSRRFAAVPTGVVAGFCLATAAASAAAHLLVEAPVWPSGAGEWLAVLGLGLMPVGAAFYVWDHGVKHGDIQVLGVASYAAPLLSTFVLVVAGFAEMTGRLALAAAFIAGGALLASLPALVRRHAASPLDAA